MPVRLTITIPAGLTPVTTPSVITPSTPTGGGMAVPSNSIDTDASSVFNNNQAFEVNRIVLESAQDRGGPIGPRSRVLLR